MATYLGAMTVVAVLLMTAAVTWFAPPQSAQARTHVTRQHVERSVARVLHWGGPDVAASAQFVHIDCRCGRDSEDWMMIQVPPAAVAAIRRGVIKDANRSRYSSVRTLTIIKSNGDLLPHHADRPPHWWKPTKLPDAEIVAVGDVEGTVYVFSEKTGTIYVMTWTVSLV